MGLAPPVWDSLGPKWQDLATAWLSAELQLAKSGKATLNLDTLDSAELPSGLQEWAESVLRKKSANIQYATAKNAEEMEDWVSELDVETGEEALQEVWCTSRKVGLNLLLLGMKFWIDCKGPSPQWLQAQATLLHLFREISKAPSL